MLFVCGDELCDVEHRVRNIFDAVLLQAVELVFLHSYNIWALDTLGIFRVKKDDGL